MTTDKYAVQAVPFLLRFSERLPSQQPVRMKYDAVRQVSLIEAGERWIDATSDVRQGQTRITRVQSETTDDE